MYTEIYHHIPIVVKIREKYKAFYMIYVNLH